MKIKINILTLFCEENNIDESNYENNTLNNNNYITSNSNN